MTTAASFGDWLSERQDASADQEPVILPSLRTDLSLSDGVTSGAGAPTWIIEDKVRNRFFRIGERELILLRHWAPITTDSLISRIAAQSGLQVDADEVERFERFLDQNQLLQAVSKAGWRGLDQKLSTARGSRLNRFFHQYLFFRVPLLSPQNFLRATLPVINGFYSYRFAAFMGVLAVLAFFLLFRRWDLVLANPAELWRPATLIWFFVFLALSKIVHEAAHGYALVRAGVTVHHFGVAFLVLWPVLFTESSEAWKITRRRTRAAIALAGMIAETYLAIFALLLWSVADPGAIKNALFMIGAFALLSTFAINLNPFMKFDGYYLLGDLLDMPNLHPRAFAQARWWVRRRIFGIDLPPPETLNARQQRFLIAFGIGTWVYRAILFFVIALLVYSFFIKVVGILLFILEIWLLLLTPVFKEIKVLRQMRAQMRLRLGGVLTLMALGGLLFLFFYPFRTPVTAPAIAISTANQTLYAETPGRLIDMRVKEGQRVKKGDVLFVFTSPDINYKIQSSQREIDILNTRIRVLEASSDTVDAADVFRQRLVELKRTLSGQQQEKQKLTIRAPSDGKVVDISNGMRLGRWYGANEKLAILINPASYRLVAFVPVRDIRRIDEKAKARFYPDETPEKSQPAALQQIEKTNIRQVREAAVADVHGGRLPVRLVGQDRLVPVESTFRVTFRLGKALDRNDPARKRTGQIEIDAGSQSAAVRFSNWIASVLIRESSF